jgi:hypothetical protein
MNSIKKIFSELKRRKVIRVAIAYIVVGWVLDVTPGGIEGTKTLLKRI